MVQKVDDNNEYYKSPSKAGSEIAGYQVNGWKFWKYYDKNAERKIWYYLKPELPANIFISINPDKKLFFSFSKLSIQLNQRLVAIRANQKSSPNSNP